MCESFRLNLGRRDHGKGGLAYREGLRKTSRHPPTGTPRLSTYMREVVSCSGRRTGADSILLGHVSVETTERYLGCKQRLRQAVNDKIGLEQ